MLERISLFIFSVLVAMALYEFVEKPFRMTTKGGTAIQKVAWPTITSLLPAGDSSFNLYLAIEGPAIAPRFKHSGDRGKH